MVSIPKGTQMNKRKREVLKAGAALMASASLAPYAAMAGEGGGISVWLSVAFGKENVEDQMPLSKTQVRALEDVSDAKRSAFLSEIILRWLKKRFPDIPWLKVGNDIGKDLARQTTKQRKTKARPVARLFIPPAVSRPVIA